MNMNNHIQQSDISSVDESRSLNCPLAVRYVLNAFPPPLPVFIFPGPRDKDINTDEGGPTISGDRCPPAIENVHTEIPMTNGITSFAQF